MALTQWASYLPPVPNYLAARDQASGRVTEKLSMIKQMPETQSPGAAAVEGAVGGALTGFSIYNSIKGGGGTPTKAPAEGLQPKGADVGAVTPEQASAADAAPTKTPKAGLQQKPAGGAFSSFFNFFK
jgi:hypothetical protein